MGMPPGGFAINLYGRTATGKTTLACDFTKKALLIRSPRDDGRRSVHNLKGVKTVELEKVEEIKTLVDHQESTGEYSTIILDNASDFQDMILKKIKNIDKLPEQLNWGIATQGEWGEVGIMFKELVSALIDLKKVENGPNVVIITTEREFNNEGGSEVLAPYVNCGLTPSVAGWLGYRVDYIVQCFLQEVQKEVQEKKGNQVLTRAVREIQYCARTGPHPIYTTKFRVPRGTVLPEFIVDPSYAKLAKLIGGS